ncbi:uncharacterized protein LOC113315441 [Papaver somniferum]|uniref:uncharacterized protein LOC113315441 n=1 Tax=Papaver somniferum TaxID=3469 RepID=UPI000E700C13|nr:uncharacterized protein LOC113315441 [Papaver somniferum]
MHATSNQLNLPSIVARYLNFALTQDEKDGGNLVSQSVLDEANNLVDTNDDCLLFARAEAKHIANIIDQFNKFSVQSVNFDKSGLAFSPKVPNPIKSDISNIFHIKKMALQDKYLGVRLLLQKNKFESFSPLMDRFSDMLAIWKSKFIAQPGKTTLNQSVLGKIASHHMDVFPMPRKITDKMDEIQRNLWWNKKNGEKGTYARKKWTHVAYPKDLEGLNINKSAILNKSLLSKLAWRMLDDPDAPCAVLLKHKYFNGDENNIYIYKDNWILYMSGPPKSNFMSTNINKVSHLIDDITRTWKTDILEALFDRDTIKDIQYIRIPISAAARCSVVFDSLQVNADEIIMNIKNHITDWSRIQGASTPNRREITVPSVLKHWKRPVHDDTEINFDAAFCNYTKVAGLGLISRDFAGRSNGARGHCTSALDPEHAEALAGD